MLFWSAPISVLLYLVPRGVSSLIYRRARMPHSVEDMFLMVPVVLIGWVAAADVQGLYWPVPLFGLAAMLYAGRCAATVLAFRKQRLAADAKSSRRMYPTLSLLVVRWLSWSVAVPVVAAVVFLRYGDPQWSRFHYIFQSYICRHGQILPPAGYNGLWRGWHPNGRVSFEYSLSEGKLHGKTTTWYENGQRKRERHYQRGLFEGLWVEWSEEGARILQRSYKGGALHGHELYWGHGGRLSRHGVWVDGEPEGTWTDWFPNGQKEEEGVCAKGRRQGRWTKWDMDGKVVWEKWYIGGVEVTEEQFLNRTSVPEAGTVTE